MDNNIKIATDNGSGSLFDKIVSLIEQARARVATAVNTAEVYTKFHIGQSRMSKVDWNVPPMGKLY